MIRKANSKSGRAKSAAARSTAELEAAVADLDQEFVADRSRPLTPAERELWRKAKRKVGRPKVGKGAQVISVSVERDLLKQADRLAKRLSLSRAGLIARGLKKLLGEE